MGHLAEKLGLASGETRKKRIFQEYGVLENPFPPANQTMGLPHKETSSDDKIVQRLRTFLADKQTQVLVVEGQPGYGKTNLLGHYQEELTATFAEHGGYYVIRYYPDPEPDFGKVVQRIMHEFGTDHLKNMGRAFVERREQTAVKSAFAQLRGSETRRAFLALAEATRSENQLEITAQLLMDYLLGARLLKSHVYTLDVQFRLDTTESKTQALHDLVFFSQALGCLEGLFLFMDELEKVGAFPQQQVVRYLSAIRALIDALPKYLFLILAMTPSARDSYSRLLPALSGRLLEPISLSPIGNATQALELFRFYLDHHRTIASRDVTANELETEQALPLSEKRVVEIYDTLVEMGRRSNAPGVTPRALLDRLHLETEQVFQAVL